MSKHTQGPWEVEITGSASLTVYSVPDAREIADCYCIGPVSQGFSDETQANARLIALAPEMLELLTLALPYVKECEQFNKPAARNLSKRILAAISKSEGGAE